MLLGTMFGRHSRPKTETTTYNAWNQIVRTENENFVTYYAYRADGLRHSKTMSGRGISGQQTVVHIWDGSQIIAEMQGSDPNNMAVVNRFIRGLGGRLIRSQQHGWYLHNARGDVTQRICDSNSREVLHAYWFSAFGVELNQDRDNHNPFRFNGEYYDFSTGRQYLRARQYDASTGRFVSPDPHWGIHNSIFGDNPVEMNDRLVPDAWAMLQAGNLYMYCIHNPVYFQDPSGRAMVPKFKLFWKIVKYYLAKAAAVGTAATVGTLKFGGQVLETVKGFTHIFTSNVKHTIESIRNVFPGNNVLRTVRSIWELGPVDRGRAIESFLGGMNNNFPVIDRFVRGASGVAEMITSIKSIDTFAASYQGNRLFNLVMKYGNKLAEFTMKRWGGITVETNASTQRFLELAIPSNATQEQLAQINRAAMELSSRGVNVIIHFFN